VLVSVPPLIPRRAPRLNPALSADGTGRRLAAGPHSRDGNGRDLRDGL